MSEIKNQDTLFSLLELLLPKKEEDGTYSHKYKKDISIIDDVVSKMFNIYEISVEDEKSFIYMILNFRIKELYCGFGEYEKAINFNKAFSESFIADLEENTISDYKIPNLIYEVLAQLKVNNHIENKLFNILNNLFSSEIYDKMVLTMPIESFKFNDKTVYIVLYPEEFSIVYMYYIKEIYKNYDNSQLEEKLCFLFDKVIGCIDEFHVDKIYKKLEDLIREVGMPKDDNMNYFILFSQYYLDIEMLKCIYSKKYDDEEGTFKKLNKKELKEISHRLNKLIFHILSMKKGFVDIDSNYYIRTCDIIKHFSLYNEHEDIYIKYLFEHINDYKPINEVLEMLDYIIFENINTLFQFKKYNVIADYYNKNKDIDSIDYYLFEFAYSLYEQKYYEESKIIYESIINKGDASSGIYNNLSLIYEKEGNFHKAQELLNTSLELKKDNEVAKKNLIRITDTIKKAQQIQQIEEAYSKKQPSVEFENLPFKIKVYLGTICRELLKENLYEIKPQIEEQNPIAPTNKLLRIIYNDVIYNNAIVVSPRSPLEAFSQDEKDNFPNTYYTYKVIYNLNVSLLPNKQELIDKILNPKYYSDDVCEEAYELWKEIAVEECLEYLLYQLRSVGFNDFNPGDKTNIVIQTLLENFSVAQIYGIIWKSVADASKLYLEKNLSKSHAANTVINSCQRLGERAILNKWDMTQYGRIKDLPQSVLSQFFFNKVIRIGDMGFNTPPTHIGPQI
ncbi:MAG: tetratricopeptide repeat protein [Oscillospiraceae bacterium]|nr:tetratricopeptide repeat protein [Oscillospiraceae bacterium]